MSWKVGYYKKVTVKKWKQVLRAREHSRERLLEKVKSESDQNKLTFNITYYPVFQNVRNILQELHILLTPDKEHKNVFQDIPVVKSDNGKSLKDHLFRAKLPNVEITGRSESCLTVRFVTLYAIQMLFLPVVRHSKFKVWYLTVTLRRLLIS